MNKTIFIKLLTLHFIRGKLLIVDTEVYPSSAEGIGLENRQGSQIPRGFESLYLLHFFNETYMLETEFVSR
jgi:hypothetical protein